MVSFPYRWTWIWRTQWDQENWSVICKIRRIHMTNTWYASDWDQAYCPSYAKICGTVVRHIQVHQYYLYSFLSISCFFFTQNLSHARLIESSVALTAARVSTRVGNAISDQTVLMAQMRVTVVSLVPRYQNLPTWGMWGCCQWLVWDWGSVLMAMWS